MNGKNAFRIAWIGAFSLLIANSISFGAAAASTTTTAAAAAAAPPATKPVVVTPTQKLPAPLTLNPLNPLESLGNKLDAALKELDPKGRSPDLYPIAKARIREVQSRLKEDPKSKDAPAWMQACSLMTEAALVQIQGMARQAERSRLQEQRAATLSELNATQVEISKLERGYASSLKSDLEEQKRKAAAAKDDAEKRFGELNSALIQVSKDARGTIISMSDILFDVGKATLTTDLKVNLAKIAGILTIYKDANVVVEGHTDNVGGEEYNQKLSELRASNVKDYLTTPGGIVATRLTSAGFGFSKPLADNATKEGKQKNRRVDLVILDKKP